MLSKTGIKNSIPTRELHIHGNPSRNDLTRSEFSMGKSSKFLDITINGILHKGIKCYVIHELVLKYIKLLEDDQNCEDKLEELFEAVHCPITHPAEK